MKLDNDDLEYLHEYANKMMYLEKWTYSPLNPHWQKTGTLVPNMPNQGCLLIPFHQHIGCTCVIPMNEQPMPCEIDLDDSKPMYGKLKWSSDSTNDKDMETGIFNALVDFANNLETPENCSAKDTFYFMKAWNGFIETYKMCQTHFKKES